jgi:hypothetical protein
VFCFFLCLFRGRGHLTHSPQMRLPYLEICSNAIASIKQSSPILSEKFPAGRPLTAGRLRPKGFLSDWQSSEGSLSRPVTFSFFP